MTNRERMREAIRQFEAAVVWSSNEQDCGYDANARRNAEEELARARAELNKAIDECVHD